MDYNKFINQKSQLDGGFGFEPVYMPPFLFDFQSALVDWSVRKGRAAIFADCGMGKTIMELVWASNVHKKTGKPVLILTPLAVSSQFAQEAESFGIEAARSQNGEIEAPIVIANYERLHYFEPGNFAGLVCDESSILKSFDGVRKAQITEFVRLLKYRLLATATAAPNDYTELGTSSEALGYLGYMDMLGRFFTTNQNNSHGAQGRWRDRDAKFRFRGHAEESFWKWVTSWARALRYPSDLGFDDGDFVLPDLIVNDHIVKPKTPPPGMLFALPAVGLQEQRKERRRTLMERCEMAAELASHDRPAAVWCHLNDEGDTLESMIPDAVQVAGKDSDERKEELFEAFKSGQARCLITKPKIGAWGLNWQHCSHTIYFPSHSYEQYYQAVRRFWRFGQNDPVTVDRVATSGEKIVVDNMQKKANQAAKMFDRLVAHMNDSIEIERTRNYTKQVEVPQWLS